MQRITRLQKKLGWKRHLEVPLDFIVGFIGNGLVICVMKSQLVLKLHKMCIDLNRETHLKTKIFENSFFFLCYICKSEFRIYSSSTAAAITNKSEKNPPKTGKRQLLNSPVLDFNGCKKQGGLKCWQVLSLSVHLCMKMLH